MLISCAKAIGLDEKQFQHDLNLPECLVQLMDEIRLTRRIGAHGFPSIITEIEGNYHVINLDYLSADSMFDQLQKLLAVGTQ